MDVSIVGSPSTEPGRMPFYASGPHVSAFLSLAQFGVEVRPIGQHIGQASGYKMTYSAITKGIAALCTELLIAAKAMGLYEEVRKELQSRQPAIYQHMERHLPTMPAQARRKVGEMEEVAATLQELGLTPNILQGAADMYRFVGQTPLGNETPETEDKSRTLEQLITTLEGYVDSGREQRWSVEHP